MLSDPFHALVEQSKLKAQEPGRLNACRRNPPFVRITASDPIGSSWSNAAYKMYNCSGLAIGWTTRQAKADVDMFCDTQSIFQFNALVEHSVVDLGVTKQKQHSAEVASLKVTLRYLCSTEKMRAVAAWFQPNRRHPVPDEPTVPAR